MAQRPARIESPEVIQDLRNRFAILDQACRSALMGCTADVQDVRSWLRTDRPLYWKHEIRRREEALAVAKQELARARLAAERGVRNVGVDEQRAVERAKVRLEEAQRKLQAVGRCAVLLDQKADKMLGPVNALLILLDQRTPQAISRLDLMLDHLEEYFRPIPGDAT
jgi:hypothetical protein